MMKLSRDASNDPSLVIIGNFTFPADVMIFLNGKKVIVHSKILDGVSVTERIQREPYEIEIECILRQKTDIGYFDYDGDSYLFPQDMLSEFWQKIWLPDTVQTIQSTYLNKLGISELIIETVTPSTFRGSKNIALRVRGIENVQGQTLIIN